MFEKILVAVDGSQHAGAAAHTAAQRSDRDGLTRVESIGRFVVGKRESKNCGARAVPVLIVR